MRQLLNRYMFLLICTALVLLTLAAFRPLHVESVAWVAERKDVLVAFFGLLAVFDSSPPRLGPKAAFYLKRYYSRIAFLLQKSNKASESEPNEYITVGQIERHSSLPDNLRAKTQLILQTHEKARRRYFARKYKGPVAVFQSEQVLREKDVYSKWIKAVPDGIYHYTTIAGSSHYSLFFSQEHCTLIAKQ